MEEDGAALCSLLSTVPEAGVLKKLGLAGLAKLSLAAS